MADAGDAGVLDHRAAHFTDFAGRAFPEHAGAEARVVEGLDQGFDLAAVAQGIHHRGEKAQSMNALRGPIGANFGARNAPDFLGVGLEERAVEAVAEAIAHPLLEGILGQHGFQFGPQIATDHHETFVKAEVAHCVGNLQRVLEESALVVDAGKSRHLEHRLVHHFGPKFFHDLALGEETVSADVEAVAFPTVGAGNAAEVFGGFKDKGTARLPGQLESGSQSGGTCANHRVGRVVG